MTGRDELDALGPVADLLGSLGIEFYIGGSVASSVHGVARTTLDIDVVAAVGPEHADAIALGLRDDYYVEAEQIRSAVRRKRAFNLIHLATMYKIDVFVMKDRPFDRAARERTIGSALAEGSDRRFSIASPEDTILNKLEWYAAGDQASERQWTDVLGVMRVQADRLDREYLDRWARELGVFELLERAWKQACGNG